MRVRIAIFCGPGAAVRPNEGAGDYAARVAMARGEAERAFELLEVLLAVGNERRLQPLPNGVAADGHAHHNGNGVAAGNGNGLAPGNGSGVAAGNGNRPTSNGHHPRVDGSRSDRAKASIPAAD